LKSPRIAAEISTYQGVPFALFAYPPTEERAARREIAMLAKRVENATGRRVHILSMANLLHEAIRTAFPPDGQDLFDAERAFADEPPATRLERLQTQMEQLLSEVVPLPETIRERAAGLSPEKDTLFLTRVGALYPAYRASALLESLMGTVSVPTILFYPGTRSGTNSLRFMDSLDALHSYRHKIY
jgi:hypothetical protein